MFREMEGDLMFGLLIESFLENGVDHCVRDLGCITDTSTSSYKYYAGIVCAELEDTHAGSICLFLVGSLFD